jgi:hypothetical protein
MENSENKKCIDGLINDLESKIKNNTIQQDDFKQTIKLLYDTLYEIQGMLELLKDINSDWTNLYQNVLTINYPKLVQDLNTAGYIYRTSQNKNEKNLAEDFNKSGYHIMEQVRAGNRSEAFYSILRIFMSNNVHFHKKLLTAFEQPDIEIFKVLLFSFLSGIISNE